MTGPWMKMHFLLNMWISQSHVSFQRCSYNNYMHLYICFFKNVRTALCACGRIWFSQIPSSTWPQTASTDFDWSLLSIGHDNCVPGFVKILIRSRTDLMALVYLQFCSGVFEIAMIQIWFLVCGWTKTQWKKYDIVNLGMVSPNCRNTKITNNLENPTI